MFENLKIIIKNKIKIVKIKHRSPINNAYETKDLCLYWITKWCNEYNS